VAENKKAKADDEPFRRTRRARGAHPLSRRRFPDRLAGRVRALRGDGRGHPDRRTEYWSVARQEAYADCAVSLERELEVHPELRER